MKTVEVVAGLIKDDGKIFATQRGYGQALARELKEELAIDVDVGDFLCTVEHDYPTFHLTMHCFFCTIAGGKAPELLEHEAARWLAPGEFNDVNWLPADVKVIEALHP